MRTVAILGDLLIGATGGLLVGLLASLAIPNDVIAPGVLPFWLMLAGAATVPLLVGYATRKTTR